MGKGEKVNTLYLELRQSGEAFKSKQNRKIKNREMGRRRREGEGKRRGEGR